MGVEFLCTEVVLGMLWWSVIAFGAVSGTAMNRLTDSHIPDDGLAFSTVSLQSGPEYMIPAQMALALDESDRARFQRGFASLRPEHAALQFLGVVPDAIARLADI